MRLSRKQLDKLFELVHYFNDVNWFDVTAEESDIISVTFSFASEQEPIDKNKSGINILLT